MFDCSWRCGLLKGPDLLRSGCLYFDGTWKGWNVYRLEVGVELPFTVWSLLDFACFFYILGQFYFSHHGEKVKYLSESEISKLMNESDSEAEESIFSTTSDSEYDYSDDTEIIDYVENSASNLRANDLKCIISFKIFKYYVVTFLNLSYIFLYSIF